MARLSPVSYTHLLASIRLLTDSILQTGDMDPATVKDFVSDIGEEAERLTRISEKLLTLTRMDSAVAVAEVPVDVKRVVEKVEHMLTPLADEGEVTVETDLQEDCMVPVSYTHLTPCRRWRR